MFCVIDTIRWCSTSGWRDRKDEAFLLLLVNKSARWILDSDKAFIRGMNPL